MQVLLHLYVVNIGFNATGDASLAIIWPARDKMSYNTERVRE